MAARLDRVVVQLANRWVTITWGEREELLRRMRGLDSAAPIVVAFESVGASRPVLLDREQKATLLSEVSFWHDEVGRDETPPGIVALRDALVDELGTEG